MVITGLRSISFPAEHIGVFPSEEFSANCKLELLEFVIVQNFINY